MRGGKIIVIVFFLWIPWTLFGQEEDKSWMIKGYLKDLISVNIPEGGDSVLLDNLIHHRVDVRWFPSDHFTAHLGLRTRFFAGDMVRLIPGYSDLIDVNNDYFDLSVTPVDGDRIILHAVLDRMYVEYTEEMWQLRAGRQRINWGINLTWNVNDVFNAYSFFDFDYEERPGSDALRFQRFIGYAGGYEVALKMAESWDEVVGGLMYKWNYSNYDLQLIGGVMRDHLFIGGGWAGNLGLSGFKGELTALRSLDARDRYDFLTSVSMDHAFPNTLYLNASVLYNSAHDQADNLLFQSTANLDIRSLSPFQWSTLVQTSYQPHPLLTGSLATLYFPGEPGIFLNPSLTVSIVSNLDLDVIGQFFIGAEPTDVRLIYGRIKYSF